MPISDADLDALYKLASDAKTAGQFSVALIPDVLLAFVGEFRRLRATVITLTDRTRPKRPAGTTHLSPAMNHALKSLREHGPISSGGRSRACWRDQGSSRIHISSFNSKTLESLEARGLVISRKEGDGLVVFEAKK